MNKLEIYFTVAATENEHGFIENSIREYCRENELSCIYYRKFKNGHVRMQREGKVKGKLMKDIFQFMDFCKAEGIILENFHKKQNK